MYLLINIKFRYNEFREKGALFNCLKKQQLNVENVINKDKRQIKSGQSSNFDYFSDSQIRLAMNIFV